MEFLEQGASIGLAPKDIDFYAFNRTGAAHAVGDICQLDLLKSATETTDNAVGVATSGLANVIVPAVFTQAAGTPAGKIYCVALEANADNTQGRYRVQGIVDAAVTNGDGDEGAALVVAASSSLDATSVVDEHAVGILLDDPGADTKTAVRVLFNGWTIGQTGA